MPINRLTIESATETAAHISTPVSVASITGDYTIKLLVSNITPAYWNGGSARIAIEESNGGAWFPLVVWNFSGSTVLPPEGQRVSWRKREAAGTDLAGTAGAELRVNLSELNGTSPSITYNATVEY
jgi:hypothetical protein